MCGRLEKITSVSLGRGVAARARVNVVISADVCEFGPLLDVTMDSLAVIW